MSESSRWLLACSNILIFIVSLPFIFSAMILHFYSHTNCSHYLQQPLLAIGIVLFGVSLVGMIGSCCRVSFMLRFYQCLMLIMIFVLFCLMVFGIVEVNSSGRKGEGERLQQFSESLQMNVIDRHNWIGIRACLRDTHICSRPEVHHLRDGLFPPIKEDCCKPPATCGYKFENGTWRVPTAPSSGLASGDDDCIRWSNEGNTLCYDCDSCKAGVLLRIRKQWWRLCIVAACLILFLVINFVVGCCAFRGTPNFDKYHRI